MNTPLLRTTAQNLSRNLNSDDAARIAVQCAVRILEHHGRIVCAFADGSMLAIRPAAYGYAIMVCDAEDLL